MENNKNQKNKDPIQKLSEELELEISKRKRLKLFNQSGSIVLGGGAILLSGLATIAAILTNFYPDKIELKIFTPVSTATAGIFQALLAGYPFDKRAKFHRILAAQTENLKIDLDFHQNRENTQDHSLKPEILNHIVEQLKNIKNKAASEEPENSNTDNSLNIEEKAAPEEVESNDTTKSFNTEEIDKDKKYDN